MRGAEEWAWKRLLKEFYSGCPQEKVKTIKKTLFILAPQM